MKLFCSSAWIFAHIFCLLNHQRIPHLPIILKLSIIPSEALFLPFVSDFMPTPHYSPKAIAGKETHTDNLYLARMKDPEQMLLVKKGTEQEAAGTARQGGRNEVLTRVE